MGIVKTPLEIVNEELDRRSTMAANYNLSAVRPVYGATENGEPFHIASCVLIEIGSLHFFMSAAHVIDWNENTTLYIGGKDDLVQIEGECYRTTIESGQRNSDKYDIAFMVLNIEIIEKLGDVRFILPHEVDPNDAARKGKAYFALGYPNSKNKNRSRFQKKIKLDPLIFTGTSAESYSYNKLKITDHTHLLIKYNKRKVKDEFGKKMFAPDPWGISGGGVWRLHDFRQIESIGSKLREEKLVGMLLEWHRSEAVIMAVRISILIEAIKNKFPDLSDLLPKVRRINVSIQSS